MRTQISCGVDMVRCGDRQASSALINAFRGVQTGAASRVLDEEEDQRRVLAMGAISSASMAWGGPVALSWVTVPRSGASVCDGGGG